MFWPEDADAGWDHVTVPGLRFRQVNPLPSDEKELRRLFRSCAQDGWSVHVVVHEAMTPDALGRLPLARMLPRRVSRTEWWSTGPHRINYAP